MALDPDSGALTYVNAGHNPPILFGAAQPTTLDPTGFPLGLMDNTQYREATTRLPRGAGVLLYTDGLTDSLPSIDPSPSSRLVELLADPSGRTIAAVRALVNPALTEDDITAVLVKRRA